MAPKKGKGKGKKKGAAPKPDSGWIKALGNGKWERPLEALPDPVVSPAFNETRLNLLATCNLEKLELRGAKFLTRYVMSPYTVAPALKELDLSCCAALNYVLIEVTSLIVLFRQTLLTARDLSQSNSLERISLARCVHLKTAHIVVRGLKELDLQQCNELVDLMLWSDVITTLNPSYKEKIRLELYCPQLKNFEWPPVKIIKPEVVPPPPLRELLAQDKINEKYDLEQRKVLEPGFTGTIDAPKTPYLAFNSYLKSL
ncbi:uncharacterized protein LOC112350970 [Selaginella moellendorffii]|uniref:uncharacterized protein LOC112350970 n=1 Tax=Selaginella moellendorffii TaxID=88036 RepID=UPI000D1CA58D|nr:uncharacterized protein LOC112350970 [Selaginella moellendorffii]|eukprot:XP_024543810.1 uncharacterized protein LOC112350970 [Selaginella moellendorffii]